MKYLLAIASAALLAAGCGDDTPSAAAPTPTATATPTPFVAQSTPEPEPPPGRTVRFTGAAGKTLRGTLTPAKRTPAPAVVLTHQYQGSRDQFDPLIVPLHRAGYTTLAYDSFMTDALDESRLAKDVLGAVALLRKDPDVDADRIALVGASIGGTTVTYVLGTTPPELLRGGVGLSADTSTMTSELKRFHPHDLLLISDEQEVVDIDNLEQDADGKGIARFVSTDPGHGVALLDEEPVLSHLLGWLDRITR